MKLKITGGVIEAEIVGGTMSVDDIRLLLKNMTKEELEIERIAKASPHSSKSNMQDKLNAKPRMPI